MGRAAEALDVSEGQREVLDALARSQTLPFRVVQRARALLLAADGVSNVKIAEVVDLTLHSKPDGHTHWSCRTMARATGISSATVQRIWAGRGLAPHRV